MRLLRSSRALKAQFGNKAPPISHYLIPLYGTTNGFLATGEDWSNCGVKIQFILYILLKNTIFFLIFPQNEGERLI